MRVGSQAIPYVEQINRFNPHYLSEGANLTHIS